VISVTLHAVSRRDLINEAKRAQMAPAADPQTGGYFMNFFSILIAYLIRFAIDRGNLPERLAAEDQRNRNRAKQKSQTAAGT